MVFSMSMSVLLLQWSDGVSMSVLLLQWSDGVQCVNVSVVVAVV